MNSISIYLALNGEAGALRAPRRLASLRLGESPRVRQRLSLTAGQEQWLTRLLGFLRDYLWLTFAMAVLLNSPRILGHDVDEPRNENVSFGDQVTGVLGFAHRLSKLAGDLDPWGSGAQHTVLLDTVSFAIESGPAQLRLVSAPSSGSNHSSAERLVFELAFANDQPGTTVGVLRIVARVKPEEAGGETYRYTWTIRITANSVADNYRILSVTRRPRNAAGAEVHERDGELQVLYRLDGLALPDQISPKISAYWLFADSSVTLIKSEAASHAPGIHEFLVDMLSVRAVPNGAVAIMAIVDPIPAEPDKKDNGGAVYMPEYKVQSLQWLADGSVSCRYSVFGETLYRDNPKIAVWWSEPSAGKNAIPTLVSSAFNRKVPIRLDQPGIPSRNLSTAIFPMHETPGTYEFTIRGLLAPWYFDGKDKTLDLKVELDSGNDAPERDESNNTASIPVAPISYELIDAPAHGDSLRRVYLWMKPHRPWLAKWANRYAVDPRAIAAAIAWEAAVNVADRWRGSLVNLGYGPGKMRGIFDSLDPFNEVVGHQVEQLGYLKPVDPYTRSKLVKKPSTCLQYIAAVLNAYAVEAENQPLLVPDSTLQIPYRIRNRPDLLCHFYQGTGVEPREIVETQYFKNKRLVCAPNDCIEGDTQSIPSNYYPDRQLIPMSLWIKQNRKYLNDLVRGLKYSPGKPPQPGVVGPVNIHPIDGKLPPLIRCCGGTTMELTPEGDYAKKATRRNLLPADAPVEEVEDVDWSPPEWNPDIAAEEGLSIEQSVLPSLRIERSAADAWQLAWSPDPLLRLESSLDLVNWTPVEGSLGAEKQIIRPDSTGRFFQLGFAPEAEADPELETPPLTDPVTGLLTTAPLPRSPADGRLHVSRLPRFRWTAVEGATGYRLLITPLDSGRNPVWFDVPASTASEISFSSPTDLGAGLDFQWQVAARNNAGLGPYSSALQFTTDDAYPVERLSPTDGAVNVSIHAVLRWQAVPSADGYDFEVLDDGRLVAGYGINYSGGPYRDTSVALDLDYGHTYRWRVRPRLLPQGNLWSAYTSFTTQDSPGSPTLLFPDSGDLNVPVRATLEWGGVTGARGYDYEVLDGDKVVAGYGVTYSGPYPETYVELSLEYGKVYRWRVRARVLPQDNPWSEYRSFQTRPVPPPPSLISPADGAGDLEASVRLVWASVEGAEGYDYEVWDAAGRFAGYGITYSGPYRATSVTLDHFVYGQTYYWKVRARVLAENNAWSETRSFVIGKPPVTTLKSPANHATGLGRKTTLVWSPVDHADGYDFEVWTDAGLVAGYGITYSGGPYRSTSVDLVLDPGTTYYWHARPRVLPQGNVWTETWTFSTKPESSTSVPGVPVLISPAKDATGVHRPTTIEWLGDKNASSYDYEIRYAPSDGGSRQLVDSGNTTATSHVSTALASGRNYYWRVRAIGPGGVSAWSKEWHFTTRTTAN